MIIFEEEYQLVLAFYLFDKNNSGKNEKINEFTHKLFDVTGILRSVEQIRYMLSAYKNVDPMYNSIFNKESDKYSEYFKLYSSEKRNYLKTYYKKFKQGLLRTVHEKNVATSTYIEDVIEEKKEIKTSVIEEYPREAQKKINALILANYKCEYDNSHDLFIDKDDKPYLEGHHLIPLKYYNLFDVSLDVEANIICLCPYCHRHIHYGKNIDEMIEKLYNNRIGRLNKSGIYLSLDELKSLYRRGI